MLDLLEKKMISYPLRITNNRGGVHEAIISTASTSEAVRPRIKIIRHEDGFSGASIIDAHSTEPWILVVHIDGEVSIWNAQNQTRMMAIHDIDMHGEDPKKFYVRSAKFIEPLQDFVVGDSVGYIHVYSYEKVEKLHNFRGHGKSVSSLAVHPIEPFVLSASRDKLIKLWNWETGWQCIRIFEGHSDWVHQVRFNPQTAMNTFASCSRDSTIKIWNMYSPTPVTSFDCNSRDVRALDYFILGGDLQYLVTSFSWSGSARIWDLQTNTCIKLINGLHRSGYNIAAIEGLPGRPILLTVSDDLTVAFCDSTTHRYEKRIKFNLGFIKDFAYINMTKSIAVLYEGGIAIIETVDLPQRFALDDGDSG
ncbi:coatomer subunit beta'-1-like [Lolium perenne]|uniref:coatomer subunit beta'-1-like n=1 Tax=Lolium perenne TaxID=4522 RepID=UPI003A9A2461